MAQLQWLGEVGQDTGGGYLARALGGAVTTGVESFLGTKEREREFEIKEEEVRYKIDALSHEKKVDAARLINSVMSRLDPEKRKEMIEDPEIQAVFASAGVPIPSIPTPEKSESWAESWMGRVGGAMGGISGLFSSSKKEEVQDFNSVDEAVAANLPAGTMITVKGRKARVD